jgi:hypothetical protein
LLLEKVCKNQGIALKRQAAVVYLGLEVLRPDERFLE